MNDDDPYRPFGEQVVEELLVKYALGRAKHPDDPATSVHLSFRIDVDPPNRVLRISAERTAKPDLVFEVQLDPRESEQ